MNTNYFFFSPSVRKVLIQPAMAMAACLTSMFIEHHVVATYNLLSLQIINHFSFISMLILQSQLNDIVLQFKQFDHLFFDKVYNGF